MLRGTIFDIQKFAIHDGPGIRTTVFLKGCPLRCAWCHNPESQRRGREISFMADRCIGCGWCFEHCPGEAHQMQAGRHVFLRDRCQQCGVCGEGCCVDAIEVIGREVSVADVIAEVLRDKPFYDESGGGLTLSGGEPMMQKDFAEALLRAAKAHDLHTCLDTCGAAPWEDYHSLLDAVDLFLFDLKDTDPDRHRRYTGAALAPILENLHRLDEAGAAIMLRCPLIGGVNVDESHLRNIADIANGLRHVQAITLHPYHPLGQSKSQRLGRPTAFAEEGFLSDQQVEKALQLLASLTAVPVRRA